MSDPLSATITPPETLVPPVNEAVSTSTDPAIHIASEQDLKVIAEQLKSEKRAFSSELADEIAQSIHDALKEQNSDKALLLITYGAKKLRSSDVHYDMTDTDIRVRMRIDGELSDIFSLSRPEYKLVLERLKYKSDLKLNITNIPQDGKYRIREDGGKIDVRVSTLPVKGGENVVCRILDSTSKRPSIDELGFMWTSKRDIERAMDKKSGMILVTGPTGSGKTTTLYSMLDSLNTSDRKVITLEDPVEYELPGVVQSEVSEKNGYTYAGGLKALLRQDPDVIMVGEIRDFDTATIAIQAALTGHLVLSTLHTKSASETLERLINMGVKPYVLASSLDIILAQRLVRKICPHCAERYDASPEENEMIRYMMRDIGMEALARMQGSGFKLHRGKGCSECGNTGFRWRVGVYEVLAVNDELRAKIRDGGSPAEILAIARKGDFITMREDGILKALRGKTTIWELMSTID